jgi:catalase
LKKQAAAEGAMVAVIAPKAGGAKAKSGAKIEADDFLAGAPSCLFDAVVVAPSAEGAKLIAQTAAAVDWVRNAFAHLKVIGYFAEAAPILEAAHIRGNMDAGLIAISGDDFGPFIAAAKFHRIWDREAKVKPAKAP